MKFITFIFAILFPLNANSQSNSFYIFNEKRNPVEFASIVNQNNKKFTYSNERGEFTLEVSEGDTLVFSHVNYEDLKINILSKNKISDTIFLTKKSHVLNEVIVKPSETEVAQYGNITEKKSSYALSLNTSYAFEVQTPQLNGYLSSIEIPIKTKRRYHSEGYLVIQVFRYFDQKSGFTGPIGSIKYFNIEDLLKENAIKFHLGVELSDEAENYFLYLNRVVPDKVFDEREEKLSVNPLLYYDNKKSELKGFVKHALFDDWYSLESWFENVPIIDIRLNVEVSK
ncbi:carboxypeptidase-like regulatory domain-containing protein [Marivirga sp.]|uniref:carboxypeptidase-like regulatory domain-containing protein n=1 Tax=Marivirga sp. TaxID=2018662 RepID=UPI002D7F4520|nr:carboxypeptidase-like regulatory domain-containing protein [Marivirga sp.]HET8861219.1 carboxypeptidase-like regulatory domain-containing protein [Marivirga sp.]